MTVFQKIYFIFLAILFIWFLEIIIYGSIRQQNKQRQESNQEKKEEEKQQKTNAEGDTLALQLENLRQENQKKIDEADKLARQDDVYKQRLNIIIRRLDEINKTLVDVNQKITDKEASLKSPSTIDKEKKDIQEHIERKTKILEEDKTLKETDKETLNQAIKDLKEQQNKLENTPALTEEDKTKVIEEIKNLNQQKEALTKEKTELTAESKDLCQKRAEPLQIKNVNQKTLNQQKIVIDKTSKLAVLQEEINDLQYAIDYNDAEKNKIDALLKPNSQQDDQEEIQKLNNYHLFLNSQLLSFDKRIQKLLTDIENIKENQKETIIKKPKTFDRVYGMEEEKEKLANIIHYLKAPKHVLGYQNVRPMGGVIIWSPRNRKKSFNRSFMWGNRYALH